jgi:phosphonate transport system substrate-binding protein
MSGNAMRIGLLLVFLLMLAGCTGASAQPQVDLSDLRPLPARPDNGVIPLRVSVAAVISPRGTAESYQPLLDYLSAKLERPIELVQRRTYAETNDLLEDGEVDLAFVCTSAYIAGRDAFGMELLAAPEVQGAAVYHSILLVPPHSDAESIADLRGGVFAFTDPISHTGRVYPTYLVGRLGSTPDEFFARTFFTYNHDDAIRAVANGLADGAAVDSLVYDFAVQRDPSLAEQVRIIHRSPAFGIPPVVVHPEIRPQLRALLREILFDMRADPAAQPVLEALGVDGFIDIDDSAYDLVREMTIMVEPLSP